MTSQHSQDDPQQPAGFLHNPAGNGAPPRRHVRNGLVGALCGVAVLALIGSALLVVSGKTITIGSGTHPPIDSTSASTAPAATPAVTPKVITKVITRWRTSNVMQDVTVPDPSGSGTMEQGWRAQIPCVYFPQTGLLDPGNGGGEGGVTQTPSNESCTVTFVQLIPYSNGMAVILKDNSGHESNFALSAAS